MNNEKYTRYRWAVVAMLFLATSVNYIDRQVIGLLKPVLSQQFHLTETGYSLVVLCFQASYAVGLLLFGWFTDRYGAKIGYGLSMLVWGTAGVLHAAVPSVFGLGIARASLGLGEAGNFPAAVKAVSEWFPPKERALATGIFNSGANVGAVAAPLFVPVLLSLYGWKQAFVVTGALSICCLVIWWRFYKTPAQYARRATNIVTVNAAGNNHPAKSSNEKKGGLPALLKAPQAWAFVAAKFFTDPVWYFLLLWLPDYFHGTFHLDLKKPGWPLVIVYSATTLGSIGGGYFSSFLIGRGWPALRARKAAMLLFALLVIPVFGVRYAGNMWYAVALISLAAAAHQAWSANLLTLPSDMFPAATLSSAIGFGGMAGSVGGILFPLLIGYVLDTSARAGNKTAGYNIIFGISAVAYVAAWIIIQILTGGLKKAEKQTVVKIQAGKNTITK